MVHFGDLRSVHTFRPLRQILSESVAYARKLRGRVSTGPVAPLFPQAAFRERPAVILVRRADAHQAECAGLLQRRGP